MPSARYLKHLGAQVPVQQAETTRFAEAVPNILIPRCQAEVDGRQCKNAATRNKEWCGQHYKGLTDGSR